MAEPNNTFKAPLYPLSINISRLRYYLLSPDEAILFDWLIVKQISFKYLDFHYSQLRIERETRIKRSRLETILARFMKDQFVDTEVRTNPNTRGQVRYFRVSLCQLADEILLRKYIKPGSEVMIKLLDYLGYHALRQQCAWMVEAGLIDGENPGREEVLRLTEKMRPYYNMVSYGYLHYRDLLLTRPDASRELLELFRPDKLPTYNEHLPLLALLSGKYGPKEIIKIVQNYFSAIYHGEIRPAVLLTRLLYYIPSSGKFPVAEIYLQRELPLSLLEFVRERNPDNDQERRRGY